MIWLKVSTARTLVIGPFLDDTDGKTAETALTISQADIRLSKNGGAFAQTNNAAGATHMENGYYSVPLDTTDTATLGVLRIAVAEAGALPVWQDLMVVPANVWDSMFGADALQVHAVEIANGLITAAAIATDAIGSDELAASAVTEIQSGLATAASLATVAGYLDTEVAAILADTNELQTDLVNGGRLDLLIDAIKAKTDNLPAAPAATGDIPTAAAVADAVWDEALAGHAGAGSAGLALASASAPSAASVADAVWDELVAGHAGVGSTGAALAAAGGSGDPWATALPGAYGAGTAGKLIGDNVNAPIATVDTVVDAIKAKTDNLPASPAAVGSAMTLAAGAITAAVVATDAIDADALAADAATEIADALLKRDFSAVSGEAARSPINALRALRNKVAIAGATMTVYKENDTTSAWTGAVTTDAAAEPITAVDPA